VVGIGKAAARPAQVGNFELLHGFDHIVAHAIGVGDAGVVFPHIKAPVNAGAQVLGKVAVDVPVDLDVSLAGLDGDAVALLGPGRKGDKDSQQAQPDRAQKAGKGRKAFHFFKGCFWV
jgi:hypothetical protein